MTSAKARWSSVLIASVVATIICGTAAAAVAPAGVRSWVARYDGHHRSDIPTELALTPDGSMVFVADWLYQADSMDAGTTRPSRTTRPTDLGCRHKQYNGALRFCDHLAGVAIADQGDLVVVTGDRQESDAGDIVTIAYETVNGSLSWLVREMRPFQGADISADIAASPDGNTVYVAGTI